MSYEALKNVFLFDIYIRHFSKRHAKSIYIYIYIYMYVYIYIYVLLYAYNMLMPYVYI